MFEKRNLHYGPGITVPGIIHGEVETVVVESANGKRRPSAFAWMTTLRTPNPDGPNAGGEPYLHLSRENLAFTTLRTNMVPGLDVDGETGEILSFEALEARRAANITARQLAVAAAAAPAGVIVDLGEAEA